jgi:hypothetical protein
MAKVRTVEIVQRDLNRTKRAEGKLRKNLAGIMRDIAREGGVDGLPKKGQPAPSAKPKVSTNLRLLREVTKALKTCVDEGRTLAAEKAALELQVKEAHDDYAL